MAKIKAINKKISLLSHSLSLLGWDQETYMPRGALEERSEQLAFLQNMLHQVICSPQVQELFGAYGLVPDDFHTESAVNAKLSAYEPTERALLRETFRLYLKSSRLDTRLVTELARQTSLCQAKWAEARRQKNFKLFAGDLKNLVALVREKAERIGYEQNIYDALLDEYEPWLSSQKVREYFTGLEERLLPLIACVLPQAKSCETDMQKILSGSFPLTQQQDFSTGLLRKIGYDSNRGRLDVSAHPFTTTVGSCDVRITTRFNEADVFSGIFSTIHECGHALYEMNINPQLHYTLLADGTSLGIHESQSRFWENLVGRSRAFWQFFLKDFVGHFPSFNHVTINDLYKAINLPRFSLIRVEADELTYNLHVLVRFNLEYQLFNGKLTVDELPEAWNKEYKRLFGLVPKHDGEGVLQDIHWAMGSFGYFPTYTLGNLYASQFYAAMTKDLGALEKIVANGEFGIILNWLSAKIHTHGRVCSASELCRLVCGEELNPQYFLTYLESKYRGLYAA